MKPVLSFTNFALTFVALTIVVLALRGWSIVIGRLRRGEPILRWQPRRAVPWGLADLVGFFALLLIVNNAVVVISRMLFGVPVRITADTTAAVDVVGLAILNIGYFLFLAIALAYLIFARRASLHDLGIHPREIGRDVWLGAKAFVMLAPIVYGIQALLVQWWPSHHPLVESLRANRDWGMLVAGAIAAVVAAPLFEEFAFRLIFQGWLENAAAVIRPPLETSKPVEESDPVEARASTAELVWTWLCIGPRRHEDTVSAPGLDDSPVAPGATDSRSSPAAAGETGGAALSNPYRSPALEDTESASRTVVNRDLELPRPWRYLAILLSSLIFALLHYQHGPDWVPLIVLALGLGYLYQRTHRLLPCITVHFLINGVSYSIFMLEILGPKQ